MALCCKFGHPNQSLIIVVVKFCLIWSEKNSTDPVQVRAPVAHWVKRWTTDLAVASLSTTQGEIFSTVKGLPLRAAFQYRLPIVLI